MKGRKILSCEPFLIYCEGLSFEIRKVTALNDSFLVAAGGHQSSRILIAVFNQILKPLKKEWFLYPDGKRRFQTTYEMKKRIAKVWGYLNPRTILILIFLAVAREAERLCGWPSPSLVRRILNKGDLELPPGELQQGYGRSGIEGCWRRRNEYEKSILIVSIYLDNKNLLCFLQYFPQSFIFFF